MMFILDSSGGKIFYSPENLNFYIELKNEVWEWSKKPSIVLADGTILRFDHAKCTAKYKKTGVADGVSAIYTDFAEECKISARTYLWVNSATQEINFEISIDGDERGQIKELCYPAPLKFAAQPGKGYTVLPRMQGTLVPAGTQIQIANGYIQERDGYMSFFGQVRNGSGYCAIFDTPYDARYATNGEEVSPFFVASLGKMNYRRRMIYTFWEECDYNTFAKCYREHIRYKGQLVTLNEKIARNPNIARLIGTPIVHEGIAVHINEKSHYYNPDDPSQNDYWVTFAARAEQLKALKERGVEKAYLHLDGWGKHGYDNLHPDVFPPHKEAGGAEGMKHLADTCRELGYIFGIHDQYRDYYYDAKTFDIENAIQNFDGSCPYVAFWYGGAQSVLCASLAPYYVRRNYEKFRQLGIQVEGSYLDVFAVVELDECYHPDHPMTREQCAAYRRACFDVLTAKGIIPSSEEPMDSILPAFALCHHAPFYTSAWDGPNAQNVGVPIPLFNLVYHDCIVVPWFGLRSKGGWGIASTDRGFLYALLNGDTIYYSILENEEDIEYGETALELHKRVARLELTKHEFIDGNYRRQRSYFADGTTVEIDLDADTFEIYYPQNH